MCKTCNNVLSLSKMIQIRHVPDALHRKLKARAAAAGMSLSDYVLRELKLSAEQLTVDELRRRLASLPPVELPFSTAEAVRAERDSR
jgi:plasmid stability protein